MRPVTNRITTAGDGTPVQPLMSDAITMRPSVAWFPDPDRLCLVHGAPVRPFPPTVQGFGVVATWLAYREPAIACSPDPDGQSFLPGAPVRPFPPTVQGFGVIDTCVLDRFAVPFISPAITMPASFFLSVWNAWLISTKNRENNSAAPIESRAECLYMMHLL